MAKLLKSWRRGSESNRRIKVLQTSPLPLGYRALKTKVAPVAQKVYGCRRATKRPLARAGWLLWSGRRDLNPRLRPWQGRTLPLSYSRSGGSFIISNAYRSGNVTARQPMEARASSPVQVESIKPKLPVPDPLRIQLRRNNLAIAHMNDA